MQNHRSDLGPLILHYRCWDLARTPPGYFAGALFGGYPAALVLQVSSLQVLQQIIRGVDDEVGQVITSLSLSCRFGLPDGKWK